MTADLPQAQPIRPPGWYRVERGVWTWLAPPETRSRDLPDDPFTLVLVEHDAEEVPLW
jgi:hypothetical protein